MDAIESRVSQEMKHLGHLGWWNHYAAYTVHLLSILASFAASVVAATGELDKVYVAILAAIPGTLLLTQNVLKFEYKCGWYYKKVRSLQHLLDRLKFEQLEPKQASQDLRTLEDDLNLEWPGFGTVALKQDGGPKPPSTTP